VKATITPQDPCIVEVPILVNDGDLEIYTPNEMLEAKLHRITLTVGAPEDDTGYHWFLLRAADYVIGGDINLVDGVLEISMIKLESDLPLPLKLTIGNSEIELRDVFLINDMMALELVEHKLALITSYGNAEIDLKEVCTSGDDQDS